MTSGQHALVHLGGKPAIGLFVVCLFAFVAETQLSQYVQDNLGFRQPYLLFYIVHTAFAVLFPLHLLYLSITTEHSVRTLLKSLIVAIRRHLSPKALSNGSEAAFPTRKFTVLVAFLTTCMTAPSLLWFIAVALAPVTDVTALWNTNAFFAYVFTVLITRGAWDSRRLVAVLIATLGAFIVVYGSSTAEVDDGGSSANAPEYDPQHRPQAPLLGDLLTLVASIVYGAYQVLYKRYAVVPDDPEAGSDDLYSALSVSSEDAFEDVEDAANETLLAHHETHTLPFGLYSNMLTFTIGIGTLLFLWIPIPILSVLDIEPFELPRDGFTYLVIAGIALSGSIFNGGFMVLIGVWGPIVVSVGSLLTIVLVFISDLIFGGAADTVTVWSILGCGSIVCAFAMLAYDMAKRR